ncbi:MAG: hypothetical protein K6C05_08770 [Anaerovibrio sp.]|uniref:ATP-binding protein n=1 Tax=Anaerovibrio sp. TaxID=1872532 RepID=UPI0025F85BCC|nr:ATP-binding protein [Anaerovibrio sp.]MCR5176924.1 hypothetical protein [Anaerovibrio sp.]
MHEDDFRFDVGGIVTKENGESYIDQHGYLTELTDEILKQVSKGKKVMRSIMGPNRIGKTSLARELIRRFDNEGHHNTLVIRTSLQDVIDSDNGNGFWPFWLGEVVESIFDNKNENNRIDFEQIKSENEKIYSKIISIRDFFADEKTKDELYEKKKIATRSKAWKQLQTLFEKLLQCKQNILLVIDEFDMAQEVFGGGGEFFNKLRGLLDGEPNALSVVTISRRSLPCIEEDTTKHGSTLAGKFPTFKVFGYGNSELDLYFDILANHGCKLSDEQKENVIYYCGRSPYYLAIMGNAILTWKKKYGDSSLKDMNIDQLFQEKQTEYYESFRRVVDVLQEEQLYWPMLQLFVGPQIDLDEVSEKKLLGYGYCIRKNNLKSDSNDEYKDKYNTYEDEYDYLTISNSFIDYLKIQKKKDVENIFSELTQAEQLLRNCVRNHMEAKNSETWKDELHDIVMKDANEDRRKRLERDLKRYNSMREDAGNPDGTDDSILNVINLSELGQVITSEWDDYKKYLPSNINRDEFTKGMTILNKVRNPVAHCNGSIVPHDDILKAKEFSKQICEALQD